MRKIFCNNKSKARVFGTILVAIFVVCASFTMLFLIPQSPFSVKSASAGSVSDYVYFKQITLESDYVGETLTNRPLLVHDSTGDLSDILTNGSDISFWDSAKTTQFNHEIVFYNSTTGELWAFVNVTSVSHTVDTTLYMYYDDSDGGYPVGYNPQDVWDSDYIAVYHMNSTTTTLWDSTLTRHATKVGAANPNEADGVIHKGQDFEYADAPRVTATKVGAILDLTVECWYTPESDTVDAEILVENSNIAAEGQKGFQMWRFADTNKLYFSVQKTGTMFALTSLTSLDNNSRYYCAGVLDDEDYGRVYINTTLEAYDDTITGDMTDHASAVLRIGFDKLDVTPTYRQWADGVIDEVRISKVPRSTHYLAFSFHSQNETTGFLTLGSQGGSSTFTLYGLTNNRVTFSGTAGNSVWCNATGDGNEWLRENISANATTNVTDILVHVNDLNDTDAWINASNIELFVSSDNATYGSLGSFTDGGSNKSVNKSTWPGGGGTNPFDGAGIIDKKLDIYFLFKITFDAGLSTDEFYTAAINTCWIKPGHYV
jgi:hypothetical protein